MKLDRKQVEKTAKLARLELDDAKKDEYAHQLSDIITYVEKINQLDTESIEPADHIADVKNVFHEDSVHESLDREAIEKVAPKFKNGHFIVPKIIE